MTLPNLKTVWLATLLLLYNILMHTDTIAGQMAALKGDATASTKKRAVKENDSDDDSATDEDDDASDTSETDTDTDED